MSTFNTSTRHEDVSLRLRAQNMKTAKEQSKKLELENRKMEERLRELKVAMGREKEEREKSGGGFWKTGKTGKLNSYATDVLEKNNKSAKDGRKKVIKVLKDEPLDVPKHSNQPGTLKYIAQSSRSGKENRLKGPKCGQCEDRTACLTCVQCSEHYCSSCFAAFHLRGALKKHRSVPLQASGPRQCMSPRISPPPSHRDVIKQSPEVGAVSSSISCQDFNGSDRNGPEGASGSFESPLLMTGDYNESVSAASFQQALKAWRCGESSPPPVSPRRSISPRKPHGSGSVDIGTTMPDMNPSPEIKFSHTISYADRLMLKQHRRTDVPTPRLDNDTSPGSLDRIDSNMSVSERVTFSALYQASSSSLVQYTSDESQSGSNVSIVEIDHRSPPRLSNTDHSERYQVQEVDSFHAWEQEHYRKSVASSEFDTGSMTASSRYPKRRQNSVSVENAVTESPMLDAYDHDMHEPDEVKSRKKSAKRKDEKFDPSTNVENAEESRVLPPRPKSRPPSRKSRQGARPKSSRQSRPNSRAYSRAGSSLGDGVLTKTPSDALHSIAHRLQETETHVYTPALEDFFMSGVKPAPTERTITPSRNRHGKDAVKVSNRLYQMAPRSWRPDSSVGEAVPLDQVKVDEERNDSVISFTYSEYVPSEPNSRLQQNRNHDYVPSEANSRLQQNKNSEYIPSEPNSRLQQNMNTEYIPSEPTSRLQQNRNSRSSNPLQSSSSPLLSRSIKASTEWSSHPSLSRSELQSLSQSPRQSSRQSSSRSMRLYSAQSGRQSVDTESDALTDRTITPGQVYLGEDPLGSSQTIVMDGDNLAKYDYSDTNDMSNAADEATLNQLEWELASESGRITADGQISRLSHIDSVSDSDSSGRSTPVVKLSMDQGFDINLQLRDDELVDDVDDSASQINDLQDVRLLH